MAADTPDATAALKAAKEAIKAAWTPIKLELARRGAENAQAIDVSSIDAQFDEALDVLAQRSGPFAAPILKAKTRLSEPPQTFTIGAVQDWVADPIVREAAKHVALAQIAGVEPDPADEKTLVETYAEYTLSRRAPHRIIDVTPITDGVEPPSSARDAAKEADWFARMTFRPKRTGRVKLADVRYAYHKWCRKHGLDPLPDSDIGQALNALFASVKLYRRGEGAEAAIVGIDWSQREPLRLE